MGQVRLLRRVGPSGFVALEDRKDYALGKDREHALLRVKNFPNRVLAEAGLARLQAEDYYTARELLETLYVGI